MIVALSSFVHGSGRSTIAKEIARRLDAIHISSGDIFREIAREYGFDDVKMFGEYLMNNKRLMIQVETAIDVEMQERIRTLYRSGKTIVLDSNLHSHPALLQGMEHVSFYVYASPSIIRERLLRFPRRDEKYGEDPLRYELERTRKDINRYRLLSLLTPNPLSYLYSYGSQVLSKLYHLYKLHMRGAPLLWLRQAATSEGAHFLDNSGPLERSVNTAMELILQGR